MITSPGIDYQSIVKEIACWRAHCEFITQVSSVLSNGNHFVLTASKDHSIRLWTGTGDFVGTFGQDQTWNLQIPETYEPLPHDVAMEMERDKERKADKIRELNESKMTATINMWSKMSPVKEENFSSKSLERKLSTKIAMKKGQDKEPDMDWNVQPDLLIKTGAKAFFSYDATNISRTKKKISISRSESAYHNLKYHNLESVNAPVKTSSSTLPTAASKPVELPSVKTSEVKPDSTAADSNNKMDDKPEASNENDKKDEEISKPNEPRKPRSKKSKNKDSIDKLKRTIFVGNLPLSVIENNKDLKSRFKVHGEIESIRFRSIVPLLFFCL
ncbi:hypothetical protein O9G_006090 [Rozella allomycis CSF55]|uniref:Uncharacterized protein n=1 Tax=Rozella allomycis (strain CSF55) TaxID=988480 RepID=A0A075B3D1_ROZAC|nr:hypothetical protein O9G_006090 [Rozella allomycis CSF55]|eukprot:EPZ36864.1 hypothetical protein O9G_006090 [Rozella allomycis CSF55]